MHVFNIAMLGKLGWRILKQPKLLLSCILKASIFHRLISLMLLSVITRVIRGGVSAQPRTSFEGALDGRLARVIKLGCVETLDQ